MLAFGTIFLFGVLLLLLAVFAALSVLVTFGDGLIEEY
jgi:hypothetical protein